MHWTWVSKNQANGTGKYDWGRMGSYRSGPVNLVLLGGNYKYTRIDVTLTQSWYGYTNGAYPPYGGCCRIGWAAGGCGGGLLGWRGWLRLSSMPAGPGLSSSGLGAC